jgi:hypothetical protein
LACAAFAVALAIAPAPAAAFERAVPERFFGVSAPALYTMSLDGRWAQRDQALAEIRAAGIDSVRNEVGWRDVEASPPSGSVHEYDWTKVDRHVAALAAFGQTMLPAIQSPPDWAQTDAAVAEGCGRRGGVAPSAVDDYAAFAGALAKRYGHGGDYWALNPHLNPAPVEVFELWNEPNWSAYWCPAVDPETYADLVAASAPAIHGADPEAQVAIGGLVSFKQSEYYANGASKGVPTRLFLERLVRRAPSLANEVDAVAAHAYRPDPDLDVALLGWLRRGLARVGLGGAELVFTEFGWNQLDVGEADRAEMYGEAVGQFARTDCGLAAIYPHTWISDERDVNSRGDWWGIADPVTAEPYASGLAYAEQIALFEGRGQTAPPSETIPVCHGDGSTPAEARIRPPRVPDSFFGSSVNVWPAPWKDRDHLAAMQSANLGRVREMVSWRASEPLAPGATGYEQRLAGLDDQFTLLGLEGIGIVPAFHTAPAWAANAPGGHVGAYARFMGSIAARYGSGGTFWDESRHLARSLAPRRFEIWSQANLNASWWDKNASASRYASMYLAARDALRAADPSARAVASVLESGTVGTAPAFLRTMALANPGLAGNLDAVYLHITQRRTLAKITALVAEVRATLDQTGNPAAELHLGFGAPTKGKNAITEAARAALYRDVSSWAVRSDCGVEGVLAHTWSTPEQDPGNAAHWYGIARPADGTLSPTGVAYRDTAASFLGLSGAASATAAVHTCGRPPPDRDGDGFPDEVEDHPLDPALHP